MAINNENASGNLNQSQREIRLPRLTLPTFDGNYQEWQSFNDMFMATVHDNSNLLGVQKFQYIKGALRGDAYAFLRQLAVTEYNYIEAYQKFVKRYSKKKLTINAYIKTFVNQLRGPTVSAKHIRQVCNTSDEVIRGKTALGNAAEGRDPWLIYLVLAKLDDDTRERSVNETTEVDVPTWQSFNDFSNKRADALEHCQPTIKPPQSRSTNIHSHTVAIKACSLCNTTHDLYECPKFKEMHVTARRKFMQRANRCYNCLCDSHKVSKRRSKKSCLKCHKRHHTLLQLNVMPDKAEENAVNAPDDTGTTTNILVTPSGETLQSHQAKTFNTGLLQTALFNIREANNQLYTCRALLGTTIGKVGLEVFSRTRPELSFNIEGLILSSITSQQPQTIIGFHHWEEFNHLDLADPTFNKPGDIDMLIGCDHYLSLFLAGQIRSIKTNLIARKTVLGWIISGTLNDREPSKLTNLCTSINVDQTLTRFWEVEDTKTTTPQTSQEIYCENNFMHNFRKISDGRFMVALPFHPEATPLGESKTHRLTNFSNPSNAG